MSSVKTIPLAGAPPSTRFTLKIAFSTTPARESIVAVTKSTASRARSKLLTLNSDISQLPSPRNRSMAGWTARYQVALVKRQLTPGLISSLSRAAGLPPFISFLTSYRERNSAVRRPMRGIPKTARLGSRLTVVWMTPVLLSHIFVLGYGLFFVDALMVMLLAVIYLLLTHKRSRGSEPESMRT